MVSKPGRLVRDRGCACGIRTRRSVNRDCSAPVTPRSSGGHAPECVRPMDPGAYKLSRDEKSSKLRWSRSRRKADHRNITPRSRMLYLFIGPVYFCAAAGMRRSGALLCVLPGSFILFPSVIAASWTLSIRKCTGPISWRGLLAPALLLHFALVFPGTIGNHAAHFVKSSYRLFATAGAASGATSAPPAMLGICALARLANFARQDRGAYFSGWLFSRRGFRLLSKFRAPPSGCCAKHIEVAHPAER